MSNLTIKNKISVMKTQVQQLKLNFLFLTAMLFSNTVLAIDIAQEPLFLDKSATPNIMFIMDDSGSMDWDILTVPHWRAYNYDHDYRRYWAKGGWIGVWNTPTGKVNDGTWHSYTGHCEDRNADGICYNELYLNDDNDRNDHERSYIAPDASDPDWGLVLQHLYFWEYPLGRCVGSAPNPEFPDAGDWLPSMDKVFTFLTGSTKAYAHSGHWSPLLGTGWGGANHPSNQNTGGGAYRQEVWKNAGPDYNTWEVNNAYNNNADDKILCEDVGNNWVRWESSSKRVLHHGPHANKPTWLDGWTGAVTLNALTGAITADGPMNSRTGQYHNEFKKNYSSATPGRARFDINGDGDGHDTAFKEQDGHPHGVKNFRYLNYLADNTYKHTDYSQGSWTICGQNRFYTAASWCPEPNRNMPGNYSVSAAAPVDNPSGKVAYSIYSNGKSDIIELGNPAIVPRYIRSTDWVGAPPRTPNSNVLMPAWAAGTKHAMSKHDDYPILVDWRVRSADFNVLYYSPTSTYNPWPGLADASFNAARSNPQAGTAGYVITENLARPRSEFGAEGDAAINVEAGFVYEVWIDDAGHMPSRTRPEWKRGDDSCGSTGGYVISTADVAASYNGAGVVDPATGLTHGAGQHVCFSYLNLNPDGSAGDDEIDLWDSHYRVEVKNGNVIVQKVRRTPHLKGESLYSATGPGGTPPVYINGSHYYWETTANYATQKVAMSDTKVLATYNNYAAVAADNALCEKVFGKDPVSGACRTLVQIQQNAANWYQYSRKRSFVAKGAIAALIDELPDLNYGLMGTSRNHLAIDSTDATAAVLATDISKLFKDIYDGLGSGNGNADRAIHNTNLRTSLYDHLWRRSATPLRQSLQRAGEYFAGRGPNVDSVDHSTSPITESCQKNFSLLLTDGYWTGLAPSGVADVDGDGFSETLADVAKKYYDEDLSLTLSNQVPTDSFDTNNKQHMTTIGIGFGVSGSLVDDNDDGWPGTPGPSGALPYTEATVWGGDPDSTVPAHQPYKIDDLWHAAYNSRGKYYQASNPDELIQKLRDAVISASASVGSASAISANSTVLTGSTRIYQTLFKSGDWTGEIKSFSLTASGLIHATPEWSAQGLLDIAAVAGTRRIITLDVSNAGIPFQWANLSVPSQQEMLRTRAGGPVESAAFGEAQLDYIRGQSDPQFRVRAHKLGDIVHSEPLYVGAPNQRYQDADYLTFKAAHSARSPMLYVGANDGMLHAFNSVTGVEEYAYIPRVLLPKLNRLTVKPGAGQVFSHRYFVDDTPVNSDVKFAGAWHSVLVGALGAGGKGIYALDVTTVPGGADLEAAIAGNKTLWEFTNSDDVDMGFSLSQPSIVRLNNGKFAAIFGNGYNSANEKAVLYIVEFDTASTFGTVHKFDTEVGSGLNSNGMSTPTAIDVDGDMKADRVYAGDLLGNVWNIDISDPDPNNWAFSYAAASPETPMFTATDASGAVQAITASIAVSEHPLGPIAGYMLNFGTGKYLGTSDNTDVGQTTQSMYGLWDYGVEGIARSDLQSQEILVEVAHPITGREVRVTSKNGPIGWLGVGHNVGDAGWEGHVAKKGWRMDLVNTESGNTNNGGERIIDSMVVRDGAILFSTLLPSGDPCAGGASGWLMALNMATGDRFEDTPFDITGDGLFSNDDFADWIDDTATAQNTATSGLKSETGTPSIPITLTRPDGTASVYTDTTTGTLATDDSAFVCTISGGSGLSACGEDPASPGDCIMLAGPGTCSVPKPCTPSGCDFNGFSEIGRQSWIQLQ